MGHIVQNFLKTHRARVLFIGIAVAFGSAWFLSLSLHYSVPILMYHDFGDPTYEGGLLSVSAERFEQQMAYLKKNGYTVISLDALVDGIKAGKKFPHKTVVITADDGNRTTYTNAYPVLKKYGFPATFFLITSTIDVNNKYLTWEEAREMSGGGMSFGSHTQGHPFLPDVAEQASLWDEIAGSKEIIEKKLGLPVMYFCYPKGGFTEAVKAVVKKAGYKAAVTTNRGQDFSNERDLYELHRVSVRNKDVAWTLWFKLSGYYHSFKKAKN